MSDSHGDDRPARPSVLRHHPGYPVWMLDDPMSDGPILLLSHRSRRVRSHPIDPATTDRRTEIGGSRETDRTMDGTESIDGSGRKDVIDLREWIDRKNAMDPDRSTESTQLKRSMDSLESIERMPPRSLDTTHPGHAE